MEKETKVLYKNTRWIFRVFLVSMLAFVVYSLIVKPSGDGYIFSYVNENISNLFIKSEWPKGEFFGIKNFPIDWPYVASKPQVNLELPSIVSYVMLIVWLFTFFGLFSNTLKFIARINRARVKSEEVFVKSLDEANFIEE